MIKRIRRIGRTLAIVLDKEDQNIYGLREGNIIDVEICKVKEVKK